MRYFATHLTFTVCSSECQSYQTLTSADRKITYPTGSNVLCDNQLAHGWYRFLGAAGTKMPTSCTPDHKCSTHATGWLKDGHPTAAEGRVSREVCFSYSSDCCYNGAVNIQVRNCGSFYVYFLNGTPSSSCSYRYCGTD